MGRLRGLIAFWVLLVAALVAVVFLIPREKRAPADTLRLALRKDPPTLDPSRATDAISIVICRRLHRTLVRYDAKLELVGDLASSWEIEDERTYVFHLRKDATFHNGQPVTARDVVWSLERLMGPESAFFLIVREIRGAKDVRAGRAEKAEGLSAPDKYTVRIELERPFAPMLAQLSMINTAVLPPKEVERRGADFASQPVGAGPFRFVEWRPNDRVVIERFDDYRPQPAHLRRVEWRVIKEPEQRLINYKQGRLDVVDVPLAAVPEVESGELAGQMLRWRTLNTYYLGFALDRPPFKGNVHLRRAINYAVDRKYLCDEVRSGLGTPAKGVLPPDMPGYDPALKGYAYDPERAAKELAAAGHPGGEGLDPIEFCHTTDPEARRICERIALDLEKVGIRTRLTSLDWGAYLDRTKKDPSPIYYIAWVADYPDPDNFLYVLFHTNEIPDHNRMRYRSAPFDNLVEGGRAEVEMDKRLPFYRHAESRIVDDAPWCFLYHSLACVLVKERVKGLDLSALDASSDFMATDFTQIRIEEAPGKGP